MSELDSHPLSAHGHLRGISSLPASPDNESEVILVWTPPVLCYTIKQIATLARWTQMQTLL